jgi:hypothetical protein
MKQSPKKLVKKTVFVYRTAQQNERLSTDPTATSIIILSTGTHVVNQK